MDLAVDVLRRGLVVVLPTDTVYGVAALPSVEGAVDRLFRAKARPRGVELPVLAGDAAQAFGLADEARTPAAAHALASRWWPGGLTLVLPRRPGLDWDLGSDPRTVGVRVPDSSLVRAICAVVGPVAATSANRHGRPTPHDAAGVADELAGSDDVALVLDGGRSRGGVASTVVAFDVDGRPEVLRAGAVPVGAEPAPGD